MVEDIFPRRGPGPCEGGQKSGHAHANLNPPHVDQDGSACMKYATPVKKFFTYISGQTFRDV